MNILIKYTKFYINNYTSNLENSKYNFNYIFCNTSFEEGKVEIY